MEKGNLIIGSHVSFNKNEQLIGSVKEAISYGATTFMFYTGAPQNSRRYPIDDSKTRQAINLMEKNNIEKENVVIHAPYIANLANIGEKQAFGIQLLKEEINRCSQLGVDKLIIHPGSHVGLGKEQGLKNIINALNELLANTRVIICLETMAGKGTELGINFAEMKTIIDNIIKKDQIGICLDTCHMFDAGYDLNEFDKLIKEFDEIIGIEKIKCIHINDSKNEKNSHKDRHANLGFGNIGFETLIKIIYHESLKEVPKILETPYITENDGSMKKVYPPYKLEIEAIKNKEMNSNLLEDIRSYYK